MKKTFALLMLASMLFASGCGDKAAETPAPPPAQQKPAASTNTPAPPANTPAPVASPAEKFSISGISTGMSLGDAEKILGTATAIDDDEFTFPNGLIVETDGMVFKNIETVKIYQPNVPTGAGIAVGMTEQDLTNAYGHPNMTENDDGQIEHKYFNGRTKIEFKTTNGVITEIKLSVND